MLEIIVADGVRAIMAHDQVPLGGRQQLPVGPALRFGIGRPVARANVPLDKLLDAFSQPKLVDQVDVEPVAEVLFHGVVRDQVRLGLYGTVRRVDSDRFPFVPLAFVSVNFGHGPGGDVMDDQAFDS